MSELNNMIDKFFVLLSFLIYISIRSFLFYSRKKKIQNECGT